MFQKNTIISKKVKFFFFIIIFFFYYQWLAEIKGLGITVLRLTKDDYINNISFKRYDDGEKNLMQDIPSLQSKILFRTCYIVFIGNKVIDTILYCMWFIEFISSMSKMSQ